MGAGGSAPKEENNDGQPPLERQGSFDEQGDDTERRMLADPSTPRNLSHPIESKDHFDDAEAPPQTSARSVSFRDPAHSVRDKKSSSSLLREMEKREQEELRSKIAAVEVKYDRSVGEDGESAAAKKDAPCCLARVRRSVRSPSGRLSSSAVCASCARAAASSSGR